MEWDFFKKKKVQAEEENLKEEKVLEEIGEEVVEEVISGYDNSETSEDEKERLKEVIRQKDKELEGLKKLLKQNEDKTCNPQEVFLDNFKDALQEIQNVLVSVQNGLSVENVQLLALLDKTETRLLRRDSEVQSFQEDFYRKTITPCIRQFIALGDMMRKVIDESPVEEKGQYFELQFGKIVESIDYILRDFSFSVYQEGKYGMSYNPQTQDVVAYKETDNPELDKKVSRSLNPGYIWTLPYIIKAKANGEPLPLKSYELIFRKEQVETFKLK